MKRRAWAMIGAAVLAVASRQQAAAPDGLYLFITPDSPGVDRLARDLSGHPFRPILLVEDFAAPPSAPFLDAVRSLGRELPLVDEEGLALARTFGVTRTPCLVRVHHGRVHVAVGSGLSVQEVLSCSR